MSPKPKIAIIDANALIHRSFHAMPALTTKKGELVNAVFGFAATMLAVMEKIEPDYIVCAFDAPGPTFRHKQFKDYKATRQKAPQELYDQFPRVKEVVEAMAIPVLEKPGFEADDILGTVAKQSAAKGLESYIVTGDKDALQLVDQQTKVFTLRRGIKDTITYDPAEVKKDLGVKPDQVVDYKALRGDPSDNIPGVPGIGEKTAVKIINEFNDVDTLYKQVDRCEDIKNGFSKGQCQIKGKVLENLKGHKKEAVLSRELAAIKKNVPVKFDLAKMKVADYDRDKIIKLFQELGFRSLVNRLPVSSRSAKTVAQGQQGTLFDAKKKQTKVKIKMPAGYTVVDDAASLKQLLAKLDKVKELAIDTETDRLDCHEAGLVGVSLSFKAKEGYYLPVGHEQGKQLPLAEVIKALKPFLENPSIKKIGHNIKYDYIVFYNQGVKLQGIAFDTMVAAYILNPGERGLGLDALAFNELGYEMMPISNLIGTGSKQISFAAVPLTAATFYAIEDADMTWRLKERLARQLQLGKAEKTVPKFLPAGSHPWSTEKVFTDIEMPLVEILAQMEISGIKIDADFLKDKSKVFQKKIDQIKKKVIKMAGKDFNISSTQQLSEVLFNKLKISTDQIKKTSTGVLSTAAGELSKIRKLHPIVPLLEQYRELTKLKSTYIDALPRLVKKSGRVHTSFNQTITSTGRLSSSDPNLQNIPVRTEEGRALRQAFVSDRGWQLLAVDYSQIDLRVMAHISGDPKMMAAFQQGEDIHARTAAEIFDIKVVSVDKDRRRVAKTVNFGVIYGMSAYGLSRTLDIGRQEAQEFIDRYFKNYPKIKDYVAKVILFAEKHGYTETLLGRRRYIPQIQSGRNELRANAERMAVNMPIQGTSADIIKLAMIDLAKQDLVTSTDAKMLLQVHDELIFEVKTAKIKELGVKIAKTMESAYKLKVPLQANVSVGKNWGNLETAQKA